MSIPKVFIDQVLEQTNIVDVIGRRLPLTKKGNNYWSLCPFHDDNNPSMAVNEDKQFFYCFVCQESGNAIHFLREYEGLDFVDAVETLASSLGLEVPYERTPQENFSSDLLDSAVSFYASNLKSDEASHAKDYLKARGITGAVAKKFNLGYAPNSWDTLFKQAHKKYNHQEIEESGLFIEKEKGFYDRFRDRIIFPIRNIKGQFIGLGGRIIEAGEPKYLNSPETKLFNKSNELFGLFEAKDSKNTDTLIVVEGYMDVIGLYQHGIQNAVATLGTAVTSRHLSKLLRYTKDIYFAFDGDAAGKIAAWRALENLFPLMREDINAKFIFFDEGEDPDSYISQKGMDAFNSLLENSIPLSTFFFSKVKEFNLEQIEGRSKAANYAMPIIKTINNSVIQNIYSYELAQLCGMNPDQLSEIKTGNQTSQVPQPESTNSNIRVKAMINIFKALIAFPKLASNPAFNEIAGIERFHFLKAILDAYHGNPQARPANIIESIENEQIKGFFSQATIEEMEISEKNATKLVEDCIAVLLKNEKDREEMLKEKYNTESISAHERRELQQLILKKPELGTEDQEWLSKLSSKKA